MALVLAEVDPVWGEPSLPACRSVTLIRAAQSVWKFTPSTCPWSAKANVSLRWSGDGCAMSPFCSVTGSILSGVGLTICPE